jgi:hypothetical protein
MKFDQQCSRCRPFATVTGAVTDIPEFLIRENWPPGVLWYVNESILKREVEDPRLARRAVLTERDKEVIAELQRGKIEKGKNSKAKEVARRQANSKLEAGARWDTRRGKWIIPDMYPRINKTRLAQGHPQVEKPSLDESKLPEGFSAFFGKW